ncbi:MAG: XdhC family protein [Deltaproteobacteria bacterium]|nr:XdhC family protein [Deltaproteobacteria bacterium]
MVSYDELAALERTGTPAVVVTVVDCRGSTPRKPGARMVWLSSGETRGTVGGGAVEHAAVAACPDVLRAGEPRFVEVKLGQELGMCCGGVMRLYLEPLLPRPAFILLGGGHVALACARVMAPLGFDVHVADERAGFATLERFPSAVSLVDGTAEADLARLPFSERAYVLVCTHDHALDQALVERCLRRPAHWLGLIASRRKALRTRERCRHKGFTPEDLRRLHSPVGLDLGAQTPEEIAVAIAAEAVALRRLGAVPADGVRALGLPLHQPQPTDVDDAPADVHALKTG